MIDLEAKIHDKFTLEFKVGFNTEKTEKPLKFSDFVMNTWIFVPNSLDINAAKYSKDDFYRDIKSDVRLITPDYPLHDLANDEQLLPNASLTSNFHDLFIAPDDTADLFRHRQEQLPRRLPQRESTPRHRNPTPSLHRVFGRCRQSPHPLPKLTQELVRQ